MCTPAVAKLGGLGLVGSQLVGGDKPDLGKFAVGGLASQMAPQQKDPAPLTPTQQLASPTAAAATAPTAQNLVPNMAPTFPQGGRYDPYNIDPYNARPAGGSSVRVVTEGGAR